MSRYIVCIGCQKVTMLRCVAVCCSVLQREPPMRSTCTATYVALHCACRVSASHFVAVCCCSVLQCVAACCSVSFLCAPPARQHTSHYVVCIGCQKVIMLRCVAVCCSVLQHEPPMRSTCTATYVALHCVYRVSEIYFVAVCCCSVLQCVAA